MKKIKIPKIVIMLVIMTALFALPVYSQVCLYSNDFNENLNGIESNGGTVTLDTTIYSPSIPSNNGSVKYVGDGVSWYGMSANLSGGSSTGWVRCDVKINTTTTSNGDVWSQIGLGNGAGDGVGYRYAYLLSGNPHTTNPGGFSTGIAINNFYNVTFIYNDTTDTWHNLTVNGVEKITTSPQTFFNSGETVTYFGGVAKSSSTPIYYDDMRCYTITSQDDTSIPSDCLFSYEQLIITLNSPVNNTRYNDGNLITLYNISTSSAATCNTTVISGNYTNVTTTQTGGTEHLFTPFGVIAQGVNRFNTSCNDGSASYELIWEFTYDTISPPLEWRTPSFEDVTTEVNIDYFAVNTSDSDLYAMDLNVTYSNGSNAFYANISIVGNTTYLYNQSFSFPVYDEYTMCARVSDSHTDNFIPDYVAYIVGSRLNFDTEHNNNIKIYAENPGIFTASQIDVIKTDDRYSFTFGTPTPVARTIDFIVESSSPLDYLENSRFDGHFVTNGNWIDFETSDPLQSVIVTKITEYKYRVRVRSKSFDFQSIGGLNINEECITYNYVAPLNRSTLLSIEYDQINPITISSNSYTPVVSSQFNHTTSNNISFHAVGNIEGGGGSVVATCAIFNNGVELVNTTLQPANNQIKSFHIGSNISNSGIGENNISVECKKDSSSNFDVTNVQAIVFDYYDENGNSLEEKEFSFSSTVTNPTYVQLGNISIQTSPVNPNITLSKNVIIEGDITYEFVSTGTICLRYSHNGETHGDLCRYGSAGSSGSGSLHDIFQNISANENFNITIEAYSSTSDGIINISFNSFESIYNPTEDAHGSITTLITSTTPSSIFTEYVFVNETGNSILSYSTFSLESLSGSSRVELFWSINNGTVEYNGSSILRDFSSANQAGILTIHNQFENLTSGNWTLSLFGSASNSNTNITGSTYAVYPTRSIFPEDLIYTVQAQDKYNGTFLQSFNVTVNSSGSTFSTTNGNISIPLTVSIENLTIVASGYEDNITYNFDTSQNLIALMQPAPLDPGLSISVTPLANVVEGTQTNVSGFGCPAELTCTLYRDGVNVGLEDIQNLSVGTYNYVFNTSW